MHTRNIVFAQILRFFEDIDEAAEGDRDKEAAEDSEKNIGSDNFRQKIRPDRSGERGNDDKEQTLFSDEFIFDMEDKSDDGGRNKGK